MKKTKIVVVGIVIALALGIGIASIFFQNDFSFQNFTVSLNGSSSIGVGTIRQQNRKFFAQQETSNNENFYVDDLISIDENGNPQIIKYFNVEGEEISVPFSPIVIEPYGEFIYIVYSNWPIGFHDDYLSSRSDFRFIFWQTYLDLAYSNETPFEYEFVAIHKQSGRVFDLKESIIDLNTPEKKLNSSIVYLVDGFAFITFENSNTQDRSCINRGLFNDLTNQVDFTVVCSNLFYTFHKSTEAMATPTGDIKMDGQVEFINLYTFEAFSLSDLTIDHPTRIINSPNTNVIYLSSTVINLYIEQFSRLLSISFNNENYEVLEIEINSFYYKTFPYVNPYSKAEYFNYYRDPNLETTLFKLIKVFPENLQFEVLIENLEDYEDFEELGYIELIQIQDSLFIIKDGLNPFIYELSLNELSSLNKIFSTVGMGSFKEEEIRNPNYFLFGQEYYQLSGIQSLKKSGNYHYYTIQNLIQQNYKFNLINKEVYLENESTPTFSYFEITPIN
jgi:hypothetical protein